MTVIGKQKEVRYLLQKTDSDISETAKKKEAPGRQGYLVVTITGGSQAMESALRDVVRNHLRWQPAALRDPGQIRRTIFIMTAIHTPTIIDGYVRLSRDDNRRNYSSIENQKLIIQKYAEENNMIVRHIYEDDGSSG